ncbi:MAG: MucB/RseB C-terminal domain-containing protein [Gammaproteobacteria bacterium]
MRWRYRFFTLLLPGLCASFAEAELPEARALLERMARASRMLNYDAVFVSICGSEVESMRVIHQAGASGERERLVALTGMAREVIRQGDQVTWILPADRAVMLGRGSPRNLLTATFTQPVDAIARHYHFTILGGDRIAGRPSWVVGISPKRSDRYGYRLWIDSSVHLPLRSQTLDGNGTVLAQVMFTSLALPAAIPAPDLVPGISGRGFVQYASEDQGEDPASHAGGWRVGWLPKGFTMQRHEQHAYPDHPEATDHQVYSDGLASISVFIERYSPASAPLGYSTLGSLNTYSTMSYEHQLTLVGEVPTLTLRRIASSLTPAGPAQAGLGAQP